MNRNDITRILNIGVSLAEEKDIGVLLNNILGCLIDISNCDAGTLYLHKEGKLFFTVSVNKTLKDYDSDVTKIPPVELADENVCAFSFMHNVVTNIADVYESKDYNFDGPRKYDALTGYKTTSMLTVPMYTSRGISVGVIQLINAMDNSGKIIPFSDDVALILKSIAAQAAVAIQNVRYTKEIKDLFYSFVEVMATAVDERTPYNGSHTRHMVQYAKKFLKYLNSNTVCHFTDEEVEEIVTSIYFHDIGKLITPIEVMNKEKRLYPIQLDKFLLRHKYIRLLLSNFMLEGVISGDGAELLNNKSVELESLVVKMNDAPFITDAMLESVNEYKELALDDHGESVFYITDEELAAITIRKGTLSDNERSIMESHVVLTDKLLSKLNFPEYMSHVRMWASDHHEYINGCGYPHGKNASELSTAVRIITILDIFDALTASDRPYKKGMSVERALSILDAMATKEGKLDTILVSHFTDSRCWEE